MAADDSKSDEGVRSVKSRRDRLAALRARHQGVVDSTPRASGGLLAGKPPAEEDAGPGGARSTMSPQQRQVLSRVYRMLTQGPDNGAGLVPGTPFLRSGVERVMTLLAQRAGVPGAPGSRVAQSVLRFIEAQEGEEAVGGASVEKLRLLAGRVDAARARARTSPG